MKTPPGSDFSTATCNCFANGHIESLDARAPRIPPIRIGDAVLMSGHDPEFKFRADGEAFFVLGLTPKTAYDVEIDNEEMAE